MYEQVNQLADT